MRLIVFLVAALSAVALSASQSSASLAGGCSARQTRGLVNEFVTAFSAGDYARLDALFAPASEFAWFSSNYPGLRTNGQARDRASLISYFRDRHSRHDSLVLLSLTYNGAGNFGVTMRRGADDYAQGRSFHVVGKGAASCSGARPKLVVISLGGAGSDKPAAHCSVTVATRATPRHRRGLVRSTSATRRSRLR